jgi:hypothetical protein
MFDLLQRLATAEAALSLGPEHCLLRRGRWRLEILKCLDFPVLHK